MNEAAVHNQLRRQTLDTAITERYRYCKDSEEKALIEMYLRGVPVGRAEDVTEAFRGTKLSVGTVSNLNRKRFSS